MLADIDTMRVRRAVMFEKRSKRKSLALACVKMRVEARGIKGIGQEDAALMTDCVTRDVHVLITLI